MSDQDTIWRELYRSADPQRIRAVATSIAAMGFDVRCAGGEGPWAGTHEEQPGTPPFVLSVPEEHLTELAPVLEEIVTEQEEFDLDLARRESSGRRTRRMMLVLLIVLMTALGLLGLLRV